MGSTPTVHPKKMYSLGVILLRHGMFCDFGSHTVADDDDNDGDDGDDGDDGNDDDDDDDDESLI